MKTKHLLTSSLFILLSNLTIAQSPTLFGLSSMGGDDSIGNVFSYRLGSNTIIKNFELAIPTKGSNINHEPYPQSSPAINSEFIKFNNKIYGTNKYGGKHNKGVLFEFDEITKTLMDKADFEPNETGQFPTGKLTLASNNKIYGFSQKGLFEYDITNNKLSHKIDLNVSDEDISLTATSNGKLYGALPQGGSNNIGCIFEYDINTNAFTIKANFLYNQSNKKGYYPSGKLVLGFNQKLYGFTESGGSDNRGTFFEYQIGIDTIRKLSDITISLGNYTGNSCLILSNNTLYGTNSLGGTNSKGVLFSYSLLSNLVSVLYEFADSIGSTPIGQIIMRSDGLIYGLTSSGGANNKGTIYSFNPAIISRKHTKLYDFDNFETGINPIGSLFESSSGKVIAMTQKGGANSSGTIFQYDINSGILTKNIDFNTRPFGKNPASSFIVAGDNKLLGTTKNGGVFNKGVIYEFNPLNNEYIVKLNFDSINGQYPTSALVKGINGKLYGTTSKGGSLNQGTIFEFNPITNTFTSKFSFNTVNGSTPVNSLIKASNGLLYGMTKEGGTNGFGLIYEYNYGDSTSRQIAFNGQNGSKPTGCLIQAKNGKMYGLTSEGGKNNVGVLFEIDPSLDSIKVKVEFDRHTKGAIPKGSLIEVEDGKLYGCTSEGGDASSGVIFIYDYIKNEFTLCASFYQITHGSNPEGSLTLTKDGKIYGLASKGGSHFKGTLFEFIPDSNRIINKFNFKDKTGMNPLNQTLVELDICYPDTTEIYTKECKSYIFNNQTYTQSGTYYDTLQNQCGKDSIIVLNLTVTDRYTDTINATVCNSYYWRGKVLTISGHYEDSVINVSNCDSIFVLDLTVLYSTESTISDTACSKYTWNNNIYTESGTYKYKGVNKDGCDSIATLFLTIVHPSSSDTSVTGCNSYLWNGINFNQSGKYTFKTKNSNGCDSTATLNLIIHYSSQSNTNINSCSAYTWNNQTYTQSGSFTYLTKNVKGCDSIATLNLSITTINKNTSLANTTLTCNETNCTYQWILCNNGAIINGATQQSFSPTSSGSYACIINKNNCTDTTYCKEILITSVNDNTFYSFDLFPNPNNGSFTISTKDKGTYYLMDNVGRLVKTIIIENEEPFIIQDLSEGVYYLRNAKGNTQGMKVIVMK
jgi:uncharacterized repeat protein (TIGR03803 family)